MPVFLENFFNKNLFVLHAVPVTVEHLVLYVALPTLICIALLWIVCTFMALARLRGDARAESEGESAESSGASAPVRDPAARRKKFKKYFRSSMKRFLLLFIILELAIVFWFFDRVAPELKVGAFFKKPLFSSGTSSISLWSLGVLALLLYAADFASVQIRRIVNVAFVYNGRIPERNAKILSIVVRYLSLVILFLLGLSIAGINISSLAVIFGALGLGVGLGMQDFVTNWFAGVSIKVSNTMSEGDRVIIAGVEGNVQKITVMNSVIRTLAQEELIVPNKIITGAPFQNLSRTDRKINIDCSLQVSYASDIRQVRAVMEEAARSLPYINSDSEVWFRLNSFADSGINVSVWVALNDVANRPEARTELNLLVWDAFKKYGIEIPFPQMEVRLKGNAAPGGPGAPAANTGAPFRTATTENRQ